MKDTDKAVHLHRSHTLLRSTDSREKHSQRDRQTKKTTRSRERRHDSLREKEGRNLRIMMFAATLAAPTDHESDHAGEATHKKLRGTTGALDGHTFLVANDKVLQLPPVSVSDFSRRILK